MNEPAPQPPGFYRDGEGRLKRQAARFRIYGMNMRGEIVRELTGESGAKVTWTVQLANTKAAWYGFQIALDIPEAPSAPPSTLRNPAVADRTKLAITPVGALRRRRERACGEVRRRAVHGQAGLSRRGFHG